MLVLLWPPFCLKGQVGSYCPKNYPGLFKCKGKVSSTSHQCHLSFTNAMIIQQSSQSQGAPSKNYAEYPSDKSGLAQPGVPGSSLRTSQPSHHSPRVRLPAPKLPRLPPSSPADITTPPPFGLRSPFPASPPESRNHPSPISRSARAATGAATHPLAFAPFFRGRTPAPVLAHLAACTPGLPLPEEPPRPTSKSSAVVAIPAG